jgi:hypothetical protein
MRESLRRSLGFVDRVGAALVAPRALLGEEATHPRPHGLSDITWLLLFRVVAGELPQLAHAVSLGLDHGVGFGATSALQAFGAVVPDIAGVLVGGLVLSLFVGGQSRPHGRSLDLAAYAWVPYLAVGAAAALIEGVRGYAPSRRLQTAVQAVALAWAAAVWCVALFSTRGAAKRAAP